MKRKRHSPEQIITNLLRTTRSSWQVWRRCGILLHSSRSKVLLHPPEQERLMYYSAVIDFGANILERVSYTPYGVARHHWCADVNGDGAVTTADADIISALQQTAIDDPDYRAEADITRSGMMEIDDLSQMGATELQ